MADLVRGEASESDEELPGLDGQKIFASEVSGEASESDEDVYEKVTGDTDGVTAETLYKNNLLQRKLIENNILIWKNLNALSKECVISSSKRLLSTDQLLIKSQISLQSILSQLKLSQGNIKQFHEKANDVFTTNFIPKINIRKHR